MRAYARAQRAVERIGFRASIIPPAPRSDLPDESGSVASVVPPLRQHGAERHPELAQPDPSVYTREDEEMWSAEHETGAGGARDRRGLYKRGEMWRPGVVQLYKRREVQPVSTVQLPISEVRANLVALVAGKHVVVITQRGKPVATLIPGVGPQGATDEPPPAYAPRPAPPIDAVGPELAAGRGKISGSLEQTKSAQSRRDALLNAMNRPPKQRR